MTQSPFGGSASSNLASGVASGAVPSNDFGATTISGSPKPATAPPTPDFGARPGTPPGGAPAVGRAAARGTRARGPRRARLQLRHISPLTVLKFSCVLAIALFFVWLILVGVLYGVLDAAGVVHSVNNTVVQLNGDGSSAPITAGVVFGSAAIVGVVNVVLFIALMTIGSVIYNLCADLVGGIEITLSER